jgi:hypothetical protein
MHNRLPTIAVTLALALAASAAHAQSIGQVKSAKGQVTVERKGVAVPAPVGFKVEASDVVKTGADGSVGITLTDNSLVSAGPNTVLSLDKYSFDAITHKGEFQSSVKKGTFAMVSGKIAKESPDAVQVRTPSAILGVRGTEFAVQVAEANAQ